MGNVQEFKKAIEKLESLKTDNADFMSNTKNWCLVRATNFLPITRKRDGKKVIQTEMQAKNFEGFRATIHTTLNHIVESHAYGNWDTQYYIILMPYNDVVDINGNPTRIAFVDTYFTPDPDNEGLVLPDSTYIVKPSKTNDSLFTIGEHEATYKIDNFTDEEIETILTMSGKKEEYEKLLNIDLNDEHTIRRLLGIDSYIRAYEMARNKKEFMHGFLEDHRHIILTRFLRDAVAALAMDKMGFKYHKPLDFDPVNYTIGDIAKSKKIPHKGHAGSPEDILENLSEDTWRILNTLESFDDDMDKITKYLYNLGNRNTWDNGFQASCIISALRNKGPFVYFYNIYQMVLKDMYLIDLDSIEKYNKNLAKAYKRSCKKLSERYARWFDKLKKTDNYKTWRKKELARLEKLREAPNYYK